MMATTSSNQRSIMYWHTKTLLFVVLCLLVSLSLTQGTEDPQTAPSATESARNYGLCIVAAREADADDSESIGKVEYIELLDILSAEPLPNSFYDLDDPLQAAYFNNVKEQDGSGKIELPGLDAVQPTQEQSTHMHAFCDAIIGALGDKLVKGVETNGALQGYDPEATPAPGHQSTGYVMTTQDCIDATRIADTNKNDEIDQAEYHILLKQMTMVDRDSPNALPQMFTDVYNEFAEAPDNTVVLTGLHEDLPEGEDIPTLNFFCSQLMSVVAVYNQERTNEWYAAHSPTATPITDSPTLAPITYPGDFAACKAKLSKADANNDGSLEPYEYIELLKQETGNSNKFNSATKFSDLDHQYQLAYEKNLQDGGKFLHVAAVYSERPSAQEAQYLETICHDVSEAIHGKDGETMININACLDTLNVVNAKGDVSALDEIEYAHLVGKLSNGVFTGLELMEDFPFVVRDNFEWIKLGDEIVDLTGLELDRNEVSTEETQRLELICERTVVVMNLVHEVASLSQEKHAFCTIPMTVADINLDEKLDEPEFVLFVNELAGKAWEESRFVEFHPALQKVYAKFSDSSGRISIEGSQLNTKASEDRIQTLEDLCRATEDAIVEARKTVSLQQTVYNSFIISNTRGVTALDLQDGPTRASLNESYAHFVEEFVDRLGSQRSQRRISSDASTRRLFEVVGLKTDSAQIYHINDSRCPSGIVGASCQTVYGSFDIFAMDANAGTKYSRLSQDDIDKGRLQESLTNRVAAVADSSTIVPLKIVSSSRPVVPRTTNTEQGSWAPVIISGVALLFLAIAILASLHVRKFYQGGASSARDFDITKSEVPVTTTPVVDFLPGENLRHSGHVIDSVDVDEENDAIADPVLTSQDEEVVFDNNKKGGDTSENEEDLEKVELDTSETGEIV